MGEGELRSSFNPKNSSHVPVPHICQMGVYPIFELRVHDILRQAFLFAPFSLKFLLYFEFIKVLSF